jgi:hypothetical protein
MKWFWLAWMKPCLPCRRLFYNVRPNQHTLVQDPTDENTTRFLTVEYDMPSLFDPSITRSNVIACPPKSGRRCDPFAALLQFIDISRGLCFPPSIDCVISDALEVSLSQTGEAVFGQGLRPSNSLANTLLDPSENIPFGHTAGLTCINRLPKRRQLCFVFPFITLQGTKSCADDLTGIVISTALYL